METTQETLAAHRDNRDGLTEFALRCAKRAERYAGASGTVITRYLAELALDEYAWAVHAPDSSGAVQAAISAAAYAIECAMQAGSEVATIRVEQELQADDLAELFGSAAHVAHDESEEVAHG